jgi:long-chain acyl-CoA synthetase
VIVSLESKSNITEIVSEANINLPDYAQVKKFILVNAPFTKDNNMLTNTGKNIRNNIYNHYEKEIKELYLHELC